MFSFLSAVTDGQSHLTQSKGIRRRASLCITIGDPNQYVPYAKLIFLYNSVIERGLIEQASIDASQLN